MDFLGPLLKDPDVLHALPLAKAGQKCTSTTDGGYPTMICGVMVSKPTVKEAISELRSITEHLRVPIRV